MAKRQHDGGVKCEEPCLGPAPPAEAEMLDVMISGLSDLDADQLRLQWRNYLGGTAPAHLPRWLLLRVLAYRLHAAALGDLDKATLRLLRLSIDEDVGSRRSSLRDARANDPRWDRPQSGRAARSGMQWRAGARDDP